MKPKKRGIISVVVVQLVLFVILWSGWKKREDITIIPDVEIPQTSGENVVGNNSNEELAGYVYTRGTSLFLNGEEYIIQGVCVSNGVAASPTVYDMDMMTEKDYEEIAALGMNTVRFLMNYNLLEDDNNPYVYKDTGWEWIDMNLAWAEKYGIHVILDCHLSQGGIPTIGGNSDIWTVGGEKQERLVAMWKAIAERYCNNTTVLGYGLLNEPLIDTNVAVDWQMLANRLKDTIRSVDKNHVLVVQRAFMEKDRSYVYPVLEDDNWILEIHEYPTMDMKLVKSYFELPEEYLFYGNDTIVAYRNEVTEKISLSCSVYNRETPILSEWTEYSFAFTAPQGCNHAYILFEILNLKEAQEIQICDVLLSTKNGKQVYDLEHNFKDEYMSYSSVDTSKIEYLSSENLIKVAGESNYVSVADNSFFRYFRLEENQEYVLKYKLKSETGLDANTYIKARIKCYDAENMYLLNEDFLDYLLSSEELSMSYGVPIYYGEVGIERNAYEEDREIDLLSYDMINWLVDNRCHFTWFTWHEPNYGMYTSSGLEPKNNPNTLLLEQMERALKSK